MTIVAKPDLNSQDPANGPAGEQAARFNARRAMTWVEDAQRSLARAAELLAPIRGAGREHARVVQLRESVGRVWPKIERLFRRRLVLDRTADLERIAGRIEKTSTGTAALARGAR